MEHKTPSTFQNGNNSQKTELKPQDLRIGNILAGCIVVESVDCVGINCYADTEGYLAYEYYIHELQGEKLTQDMLLRFGFEKTYAGETIDMFAIPKLQEVEVLITENGESQLRFHGIKIQCSFVHELQNFFSSTYKTELTLK